MPTLRGQSSVAHHNLRTIVRAVQASGALSRREVSRRTGLATPTVTRHVNELVAAGVLRSMYPPSAENNGPGRPAEELELKPEFGSVLGVDVGEHTIRAAIADFAGNVAATSSRPTRGRQDRDASLDQLVAAIGEVLEKTGLGKTTSREEASRGKALDAETRREERASRGEPIREEASHAEASHAAPSVKPRQALHAAVIGVPGMVDVRKGVVIDAPNLSGWRNLALEAELRARLDLGASVRIENDVNLAAVGESARGAAKGFQDFVFVSIRRGIGAGIFLDGRLMRGHAGMAGELGFMSSTASFDHRQSAGLGHLETTAGEQTLLDRVQERGSDSWTSAEKGDDLSIRDLCLAVRDGHPEATAIMEEALQNYGVAVANIVSVLDPELVVIGGDVAVIGETAVKRIRDVVSRLVPHEPELRSSRLSEDAALQGALHQAQMHACDALPGVIQPVGGG